MTFPIGSMGENVNVMLELLLEILKGFKYHVSFFFSRLFDDLKEMHVFLLTNGMSSPKNCHRVVFNTQAFSNRSKRAFHSSQHTLVTGLDF